MTTELAKVDRSKRDEVSQGWCHQLSLSVDGMVFTQHKRWVC